MEKEERTLKMMFNKDGYGNTSPKLSIPKKWATDMGLGEGEREVVLEYDFEEKIIIIKKK